MYGISMHRFHLLICEQKDRKIRNPSTDITRGLWAYRSPEKQFQSINTFEQSYDYTIMLIKREDYLLFEIDLV